MHKVLQPQLPQEQLKEVYSRICELLNTKVPKHFEDVSPATPAGQQRVVDDVVHLATTLSRLRAVQARARARGESARARASERERDKVERPRCRPRGGARRGERRAGTGGVAGITRIWRARARGESPRARAQRTRCLVSTQ